MKRWFRLEVLGLGYTIDFQAFDLADACERAMFEARKRVGSRRFEFRLYGEVDTSDKIHHGELLAHYDGWEVSYPWA